MELKQIRFTVSGETTMPLLIQRLSRNLMPRLVASVGLLISLSPTVATQENSPERGFRSEGSYAISDIETISSTSGNMMVKIPLAGLPAGRGGLSTSLSLMYNSKLYDTFPITIQSGQSYPTVSRLKKSQAAGGVTAISTNCTRRSAMPAPM